MATIIARRAEVNSIDRNHIIAKGMFSNSPDFGRIRIGPDRQTVAGAVRLVAKGMFSGSADFGRPSKFAKLSQADEQELEIVEGGA